MSPSRSSHSLAEPGGAAVGVGLGWRRETALACERYPELAFTEVVAESISERLPLAPSLAALRDRGIPIIAHGVSLSLASADPPERSRLSRLRRIAERLASPFVSEHIAFVRGAGLETEHLLPIPRTRENVQIVVENIQVAQDALGIELVLENIANLFEWTDSELDEAAFIGEIVDQSDSRMLLDVSNLYANSVNHGVQIERFLSILPLDRVAYIHIAGGRLCGGFRHDTHADPVDAGPLQTLRDVLARTGPLPILLERDDRYGTRDELESELDTLMAVHRQVSSPTCTSVHDFP